MTADYLLSVSDVTKIFLPGKEAQVTGLKNINLEIDRGEFAVISGPSGSGKTTLLNIMGGLDLPSSGEVILDGISLPRLKEKKRSRLRRDHIGFVFQAYNLIPVLSVKDNISYIMRLKGKTIKECEARVHELAVTLDIEDLLDKLPNQLSGGQQQRTAVARAVASKPKLILADEPTANLDSRSGAGLMDMMQELNTREKITIIFSSHDPMVIGKARHSVVLQDGRIIENISP